MRHTAVIPGNTNTSTKSDNSASDGGSRFDIAGFEATSHP